MKKIIIFILFSLIWFSSMAGNNKVLDEINAIKKAGGNTYEGINLDELSKVGVQEHKYDRAAEILNTPMYVGNDPRLKGFGQSKYDQGAGLAYDDLNYRTLEDYRNEQRQAEIKSISLGVFVGVLILTLIVSLMVWLYEK
ncbi:MAG: hypothetical protein EZS26_000226 [Candidatus Ordinivivax streblomastigis]|uniref:Uncharacterized protein n=1 Tax=Candidatus Ordinivivax streblomastigis TaxID=2540710 RepID=A0A5M8P562_9BACT|nr:MAG: hypothetical protein EZS26_000226 [Candidatus Ordinivivax streblomastigis]